MNYRIRFNQPLDWVLPELELFYASTNAYEALIVQLHSVI